MVISSWCDHEILWLRNEKKVGSNVDIERLMGWGCPPRVLTAGADDQSRCRSANEGRPAGVNCTSMLPRPRHLFDVTMCT